MNAYLSVISAAVGWLVLTGLGLWSVLAIVYNGLPGTLRVAYTVGLGLALMTAAVQRRWWKRLLPVCLAFVVVLAWWLHLEPSNNRHWQPDVAVPATAEMQGDLVTIHNVRNCDYRSVTDYTVRYEERQVRLAYLQGVDLFQVFWGAPGIAHTMLSFDFGDGSPVCFSIEARKTVDEEYSPLAGFFRNYELVCVVGDERDLVRLRTNFRHEDVYLYRLTFNPEVARAVFVEYLQLVNDLAAHPQWYNALLSNCTTSIRALARSHTEDARWDWRLLVNGFVHELAYERGMLNTTWTLEELRRRGHINDRANGIGDSPDFSALIREDVPLAMPESIMQDDQNRNDKHLHGQ